MKFSKKIAELPIATRLLLSFSLLIISGQIKIDIGIVVPFTLQTLVVCLIIYGFNFWQSFLVLGLYFLMAFSGIPILSGWNSLNENNFFSSGGFLIGFLAAAFTFCTLKGRFDFQNFISIMLFALLIHLTILVFGILFICINDGSINSVLKNFAFLLPGALIKSLLFSIITNWFKID